MGTRENKFQISVILWKHRQNFIISFISPKLLQSKQVKRSSHEWINNFITANLISGIISIIWLLDE